MREQRKADRQAGGDTRPPQRKDRPFHLLLAHSADNFVDQRGRQARPLLDGLGLAFADCFPFLYTSATRLIPAHVSVVSRTAIASARRYFSKRTSPVLFVNSGPGLAIRPLRLPADGPHQSQRTAAAMAAPRSFVPALPPRSDCTRRTPLPACSQYSAFNRVIIPYGTDADFFIAAAKQRETAKERSGNWLFSQSSEPRQPRISAEIARSLADNFPAEQQNERRELQSGGSASSLGVKAIGLIRNLSP